MVVVVRFGGLSLLCWGMLLLVIMARRLVIMMMMLLLLATISGDTGGLRWSPFRCLSVCRASHATRLLGSRKRRLRVEGEREEAHGESVGCEGPLASREWLGVGARQLSLFSCSHTDDADQRPAT